MNMIKRKLIACAVVALAFVGGSLAYYSQQHLQQSQLTPLVLANIEALSEYESPYPCPGACMEWKGNDGGGIACDCSHYVGKCTRRCP